MPINTRTVTRRAVRLATLDDVLAEARRLARADHEGRLVRLGNWPLGTALGHLAAWIDYAYDGYPPDMKPPFFVRWIARLMKSRFINSPMPQGFRIPRIEAGTFGVEPLSTDEGLARLTRAVERLRTQPARFHSPALGPLTDDERRRLNIGHAELHMGYYDIRD